MIVKGSVVKVIDKSGALQAQCIRFIDRARFSYAGMRVLIVVKKSRRPRKKKRSIGKGEMHYALIVKRRGSVKRSMGYSVHFPCSSVILLKKSDMTPISNRITNSVSKDLRFIPGFSRVLSMAYDIF